MLKRLFMANMINRALAARDRTLWLVEPRSLLPSIPVIDYAAGRMMPATFASDDRC